MQPANSGLTRQQWLGAQAAMQQDIERARRWWSVIWAARAMIRSVVLMLLSIAVAMIAAPMLAAAQGTLPPIPTTFGDNLMLLSALLGAVLPALIAVVVRRNWSSERKGITALAICIIAGAALTAAMGRLDPKDIATSTLIVFTIAQILYQTYWRPSGIADTIEYRTG